MSEANETKKPKAPPIPYETIDARAEEVGTPAQVRFRVGRQVRGGHTIDEIEDIPGQVPTSRELRTGMTREGLLDFLAGYEAGFERGSNQ